jgi:hypothetical protein
MLGCSAADANTAVVAVSRNANIGVDRVDLIEVSCLQIARTRRLRRSVFVFSGQDLS